MPKAKPAKAQPKAQDPVKVDPKHYKVEVENKQVRCGCCGSVTGLARSQ